MAESVKKPDIPGAEKKLRQAEFFLNHLRFESEQSPHAGEIPEKLEYFFSACLSAAQSVYYVLEETGKPAFKAIRHAWITNLKDDAERSRFNGMMGIRGKDVHFATTGAVPMQKYVKDDWVRRSQGFVHFNTAIFGHERFEIEEINPDGTKVSGSSLRGSMGLYFGRDGRSVESTTACREFIDQLRSLVEAVRNSAAE